MTKAELITQIAEKSELSKKDSEKALAAVISSIKESKNRRKNHRSCKEGSCI